MDYAYFYGCRTRIYLNVTNRCSNDCLFCVRRRSSGLGDGRLAGGDEPDLDGLLAAVEARRGAEPLDEIIWCGFGEPTFRLDLIKAASPVFRSWDIRVRLNTNGHACLIHGRDVVAELAEAVDAISVSINAPSRERYVELCRPGWDMADELAVDGGAYWEAAVELLARATPIIDDVRASVVGKVLTEDEIEACRRLAESVGCSRFRVR